MGQEQLQTHYYQDSLSTTELYEPCTLHRVLDPYSMEIFQKEVPVLVGIQLTVKVDDHCNNGMQACILLINVYLEKLTPSI